MLLAVALLTGACATQTTVTREEHPAGLSRPTLILVYDFAYGPGQVRLDRGVIPEVVEAAKSAPRSAQELELGRKVADVVAEHIVARLRKAGLPAQRVDGHALPMGNTLSVEGQFLSVDAGNATERTVVGFGAGRSEIDTHVQVYLDTRDGHRLIEALDVESKSRPTPGLVPAAVGAHIAGRLLVTVAAKSGVDAARTVGSGIDADGRRLANAIADKLVAWYQEQDWQPAAPR